VIAFLIEVGPQISLSQFNVSYFYVVRQDAQGLLYAIPGFDVQLNVHKITGLNFQRIALIVTFYFDF
jgi:hypothetical protein